MYKFVMSNKFCCFFSEFSINDARRTKIVENNFVLLDILNHFLLFFRKLKSQKMTDKKRNQNFKIPSLNEYFFFFQCQIIKKFLLVSNQIPTIKSSHQSEDFKGHIMNRRSTRKYIFLFAKASKI